MRQPSRNFDFKVKYISTPLATFKKEDIVPFGWVDEFGEENEVITIPLLVMPCVMGINIWYDFDEEPSVNHMTISGRVY